MHMRKKKWSRPELAACDYYTSHAEQYRGKWASSFKREQPLYLELGCGKGVSTAAMIRDNPDVNYIAVDISPDVLGVARRNLEAAFGDDPVENAMIVHQDIEYITNMFTEEDRIDRIYIHFCNPWSMRPKHAKRRLTHPRQLAQYRQFLRDGGEIWFKTDDDDLFRDSLVYFDVSGFECRYITYDLHGDGFEPNYVSEHEKKYTEMGVPIKFGIFVKKPGDMPIDPVEWGKEERHGRAVDPPKKLEKNKKHSCV